MSQELYKYSQYNIIVQEKENQVFLFNTYTSKGRWIPKSDLDDIKDNPSIDIGDVPIYLAEEQYIVPTSTDELHSERPYKIQHVDFEVTPFCNENCVHCFNYWRAQTDRIKDIEFNKDVTSQYFLDIGNKIIELHPKEVLITGGEPLSIFDKIKETIDLFLQNGIKVKINTNGTFITDSIAGYFYKNNLKPFISLPCADSDVCDQITGLKDSLKKIESSILLAKQHDVNIVINMVVNKMNIDYIYSTAEYVKSVLGINHFMATKVMAPCGSNPMMKDISLDYNDFQFVLNELLRIRDTLKMEVDSAWEYSLCGLETSEQIKQFAFRRKCRAGINHICITNNGDIKPCSVSDKTYGNILSDNILNVMKQMKCWRDNSLLPTECLECKHLKYCGGGCRLDAENTYEDIHHIDSTANPNNKDIDYENYYKQFLQKNIKASGKYS